MPEQLRPISEQAVMSNMGITEQNIERRKRLVGFGPDDAARIAGVRDVVVAHADALTATFFDFLSKLEEARVLFGYRELADQARELKRAHLIAMVQGNYDLAYVEQRVKLGLLYGRVGLDIKVFLGAFRELLAHVGRTILREACTIDAFEGFASLQKIAFFDIGVLTDVLIHERDRTINLQSQAIRELSTPVLQIRDRLLLLPLIGLIDTHRAQLITENLLHGIRTQRARVVVMDVTGVATIDSRVANHLVQTVSAARLMGALVIVTGVSAEVAQSLVTIGIDLEPFTTVGDLQSGVEEAERLLGYKVSYEPSRFAPAHERP